VALDINTEVILMIVELDEHFPGFILCDSTIGKILNLIQILEPG
jgi:hypothetical protein